MKKIKNKIRRLLGIKKTVGFEREFRYGRKIPLMEQIQNFIKKEPFASSIQTFVETGTYEGETIEVANKYFKKCYTIELSQKLHSLVSERLSHTNIKFELGDSSEILTRLASEITEPAFFYLDAHFSGGETAKGDQDVPLLQEIATLGKRSFQDVIIIDDASLFGYSSKDGLNEDWSQINREGILDAFGGENIRHVFENDRMLVWRAN